MVLRFLQNDVFDPSVNIGDSQFVNCLCQGMMSENFIPAGLLAIFRHDAVLHSKKITFCREVL